MSGLPSIPLQKTTVSKNLVDHFDLFVPNPLGKGVGEIEEFDFGLNEIGFVESDVQWRVVVVGNLAGLVQHLVLQRRQGHGGIE